MNLPWGRSSYNVRKKSCNLVCLAGLIFYRNENICFNVDDINHSYGRLFYILHRVDMRVIKVILITL